MAVEPLLGHELLKMGGAQLMSVTLQMAVRCQDASHGHCMLLPWMKKNHCVLTAKS
jgi:hypothetical protein